MPKRILHLLHEERARWVLWLPVLIGAGVGAYFALPTEPYYRLGAGLLASCIVLWRLLRRFRFVQALCVMGIALSAGFTAAQMRAQSVAAPVLPHDMKYRDVSGVVEQMIDKEKGIRLILRDPTIEDLEPERTPQRISISSRHALPELAVGDEVTLKAGLFPPPRPVLPGTYDFARSYYFERIGAVGFAQSELTVTHQAVATVGTFSQWLANVRYRLSGQLQALIPGAAGTVAAALVMGDQKAIPEQTVQVMRDSGLAHVLSISGLHLSLAAGIVFLGMRFALLALLPRLALYWNIKKIAAIFALLSAFAYLLLAGNPVPAQRSFVMVAFVLVAVLFDRRGISLYSLAWAAVLILLFEPESMLGASFQMSFAATMAMLAFYERYGHLLADMQAGWLRKFWLYLLGIALTSLVATLATLPLALMHFNRVTVWGIVANLAMIPLASFVIMPAVVLFFLLMPLGCEARAAKIMEFGIDAMIRVANWVAQLPGAVVVLPSMTMWGFLLCIAGGLWLCLWSKRWRLWGLLPMMLGLATVALYNPPDVMLSDDGKQVAVRVPSGELTFLRGTGKSFDAEIFLRSDGREMALGLKDAMVVYPDRVMCEGKFCRYRKNGHSLLLIKKREMLVRACGEPADIAVADFYIDGKDCPNAARIIDRRALYRHGSQVLYFAPEAIRTRTANELRGHRPWVK